MNMDMTLLLKLPLAQVKERVERVVDDTVPMDQAESARLLANVRNFVAMADDSLDRVVGARDRRPPGAYTDLHLGLMRAMSERAGKGHPQDGDRAHAALEISRTLGAKLLLRFFASQKQTELHAVADEAERLGTIRALLHRYGAVDEELAAVFACGMLPESQGDQLLELLRVHTWNDMAGHPLLAIASQELGGILRMTVDVLVSGTEEKTEKNYHDMLDLFRKNAPVQAMVAVWRELSEKQPDAQRDARVRLILRCMQQRPLPTLSDVVVEVFKKLLRPQPALNDEVVQQQAQARPQQQEGVTTPDPMQ